MTVAPLFFSLRQYARIVTPEGFQKTDVLPADSKARTLRAMMAGNGKMQQLHFSQVQLLMNELGAAISGHTDVEVVVATNNLHLKEAVEHADKCGLSVAAEDVSVIPAATGAFTGEVSAAMLQAIGVKYAIVGHSERRHGQVFAGLAPGETNKMVAAKTFAAMQGSLIPIVCVGETLAEREAGRLEGVLTEQVETVLDRNPDLNTGRKEENGLWAYEPVWAIGTGKAATPADADHGCGVVRNLLRKYRGERAAANTRILYGGSVTPENAAEIMKGHNVDGGLVGGAFLDASTAIPIVRFGLSALGGEAG